MKLLYILLYISSLQMASQFVQVTMLHPDELGWTDMGPADTITGIFFQPIFLPIHLNQYIGHQYLYQYFHVGQCLAD
jgi:hypothetical protein